MKSYKKNKQDKRKQIEATINMYKYLYEEIRKIKRLEKKEPNLDLSKYAVREEETKRENNDNDD